MVNVLDRHNVAGWRLHYVAEEDAFRRAERTLLPRTVVASVRVSW